MSSPTSAAEHWLFATTVFSGSARVGMRVNARCEESPPTPRSRPAAPDAAPLLQAFSAIKHIS
jgi:hypothetical protein